MAQMREPPVASVSMNLGKPPQTYRSRPAGPLLFVLVISGVVMAVALALVVWLYWLGGVLPG